MRATETTDCICFYADCISDSHRTAATLVKPNQKRPSMIVIGKHRYCSLVELEADAVPLIEASALGYLRSGAESEATLRR